MADGSVVHASIDTRAAQAFLSRLADHQVPFARALMLTRTAEAARDDVRSSMPARFTIRRMWEVQSVSVHAAKKHDASPSAEVGTPHPYMVKQEEGGAVAPAAGKKLVAIPAGVRASKRQVVPRSRWPAELLKKEGRNAVYFTDLGGGSTGLIKANKSGRIKLLWVFRPSVSLEPRFGFEETVTRSVEENWERAAAAALDEAVRTARPPK